jgi:hypothetical protein
VLVTTSVSWWRRRWSRELPIAEFVDRPAPAGQDAAADFQDLWEALGHLPRGQRAVVVLRYIEDRTEGETADTGRATNGGTEAINGLIELHRRVARGFRNRDNYRLRMLLIGGGLAHPHLK